MDDAIIAVPDEPVLSPGNNPAGHARSRMLAAGNTYHVKPVIRMDIRLEDGQPKELSPEWLRRLAAELPVMRPEVLDFPGWQLAREANAAIPLPTAIELLALLLQRSMGWPVSFMLGLASGRRESQAGDRPPVAVFETRQRASGMLAGRLALDLCRRLEQAVDGEAGPLLSEALTTFRRRTGLRTPSRLAMWITERAEQRGIPWSPLPDNAFLRLGRGRNAEMLRGFDTSLTSCIASNLAKRKDVTQSLLTTARLPVATQRIARTATGAIAAAQAIGFPVVVKPRDGSQGRAVSVGLTSDEEVAEAFAEAQTVSSVVVVESLIEGDTFRISVIGGRFFAAALRHPPRLKGDGLHTVEQLIAKENRNPERQPRGSMDPIVLDDEMMTLLAEQGLSPRDVPEAGRWVKLRRVPNPPYGDKTDVTDMVHPSIRALSERVAGVLGISVCGIDFITTDISRPCEETGGAICEVNTLPDLGIHLRVSEGTSRDGAEAVLNMLYPPEKRASFPIVVVLREETDDAVEHRLLAAWEERGRVAGLVSALGGSQRVTASAFVRSLRALDLDPDLDLCIVVLSPRQLVERGLGYDSVDLVIAPPPEAGTGVARRARRALERVARRRVLALDDPDLVQRSLEAIEPRGKPRRPKVVAQPVDAAPAERAAPARLGSAGRARRMRARDAPQPTGAPA